MTVTHVTDCPTPDKKRFATKRAAEAFGSIAGLRLTVYLCQCSMFHLSMRMGPALSISEQQIEKLTQMTDEEFVLLVKKELRGKVTPEEEAALRSPHVVARWEAALKQENTELEAILAAKKGYTDRNTRDWRASIIRRQGFIRSRRLEIKSIKSDNYPVAPIIKDRQENLAQQARSVAKRALAYRHLDEYLELVDQERAARGLPPQARYEKSDFTHNAEEQ